MTTFVENLLGNDHEIKENIRSHKRSQSGFIIT